MTNLKISQLTDASTVDAADELAIVQSGTTKRATAGELRTLILGGGVGATFDSLTLPQMDAATPPSGYSVIYAPQNSELPVAVKDSSGNVYLLGGEYTWGGSAVNSNNPSPRTVTLTNDGLEKYVFYRGSIGGVTWDLTVELPDPDTDASRMITLIHAGDANHTGNDITVTQSTPSSKTVCTLRYGVPITLVPGGADGWEVVGAVDDAVSGPASATDNAVARFDGTGGKTLQNSGVTIDDNGTVNIPSGQTYNINGSAHTHSYAANAFKTIAVSGQDNIVADAADDTLTIAAGTNVTITTNAANDTITIAATGGSGTGDVTGPASSTDGEVALFDGTTGKVLKSGSKTIRFGSWGGYDAWQVTGSPINLTDDFGVIIFVNNASASDVVLPTVGPLNHAYFIHNMSTGTVTVKDQGANTIATVTAGKNTIVANYGAGSWVALAHSGGHAETEISFSDVTTGNATTGQHGYLPKLGGGTTNFLRADGTWAAPAGGSSGITMDTADPYGIHHRLTTADADDDEFSDASIAAAWTQLNNGGTVTWSEANGALHCVFHSLAENKCAQIIKSVSLSDGESIETCTSIRQEGSSSHTVQAVWGIIFTDRADGDASQKTCIFGLIKPANSVSARLIGSWTGTYNAMRNTGVQGYEEYDYRHTRMKVTRVSSTQYDVYFSTDAGGTWAKNDYCSNRNPGFTPTHIGLFVSNFSSATLDTQVHFDYFRVV